MVFAGETHFCLKSGLIHYQEKEFCLVGDYKNYLNISDFGREKKSYKSSLGVVKLCKRYVEGRKEYG